LTELKDIMPVYFTHAKPNHWQGIKAGNRYCEMQASQQKFK